MPVDGLAVGGAAELPVVRPPRVGRFDHPPQAQGESVGTAGWGFGATPLNIEIDQAPGGQSVADDRVVIRARASRSVRAGFWSSGRGG